MVVIWYSIFWACDYLWIQHVSVCYASYLSPRCIESKEKLKKSHPLTWSTRFSIWGGKRGHLYFIYYNHQKLIYSFLPSLLHNKHIYTFFFTCCTC